MPVTYFSMGGWFYGLTRGHELKNVFLRIEQFRLARDPAAALRLARQFFQGKIRNHRTLLMRNHVEPPASTLLKLKQHADAARRAQALDELLGIEGGAAAAYFEQFSGMLKFEEERGDDGPARETREGCENGRLTEEGEQDRSPDAAQPVVGDPPSPAVRGTGSGASPFRFDFRFTLSLPRSRERGPVEARSLGRRCRGTPPVGADVRSRKLLPRPADAPSRRRLPRV